MSSDFVFSTFSCDSYVSKIWHQKVLLWLHCRVFAGRVILLMSLIYSLSGLEMEAWPQFHHLNTIYTAITQNECLSTSKFLPFHFMSSFKDVTHFKHTADTEFIYTVEKFINFKTHWLLWSTANLNCEYMAHSIKNNLKLKSNLTPLRMMPDTWRQTHHLISMFSFIQSFTNKPSDSHHVCLPSALIATVSEQRTLNEFYTKSKCRLYETMNKQINNNYYWQKLC